MDNGVRYRRQSGYEPKEIIDDILIILKKSILREPVTRRQYFLNLMDDFYTKWYLGVEAELDTEDKRLLEEAVRNATTKRD